MIPWWRTGFGNDEIERLTRAVAQEHIGQGPVTAQLEAELAAALGVPFAVMTTSGSGALLIALLAADVGPDDEVIMPNRTWVATAHAALLIRAKATLVDVRPDIPIMDVSELAAACTTRTKVVMPVHLNGRATDMATINRVARERNLVVIEDACQALFSRNADGYLGTQSDIGCFSLGLTKLISTGQGGFAVTRDARLYERMKLIRNHGVVDQFTDRWNQVGFNLKFTDLLSSFGLAQLRRAGGRIAHLQRISDLYGQAAEAFDFLAPVPVRTHQGEVAIYAEVRCADRSELMNYLTSRDVQTRAVPPSLSVSPYIETHRDFPRSQVFATEGLYLPGGPEQKIEDVERVIEILAEYPKHRGASASHVAVSVQADAPTAVAASDRPEAPSTHADHERVDYVDRVPTVDELQRLRRSVGWRALDGPAMERALAGSVYGVCACLNGEVIGVGRLVGDGALYFDIVDVLVLPQFRGHGIGEGVVTHLLRHVEAHATDGSFVSLFAARGVAEFYERFGFRRRFPESPGMFMEWPRR